MQKIDGMHAGLLFPPEGIGLQTHIGILHIAHAPVRPGAHGHIGGKGIALHHREGEGIKRDHAGIFGGHGQDEGILHGHFLDAAEPALIGVIVSGVSEHVKGIHHILSHQFHAIMEQHAAAQVNGPGFPILGLVPAIRQHRLGLQIFVQFKEGFINQGIDADHIPFVAQEGIELCPGGGKVAAGNVGGVRGGGSGAHRGGFLRQDGVPSLLRPGADAENQRRHKRRKATEPGSQQAFHILRDNNHNISAPVSHRYRWKQSQWRKGFSHRR